MTPASRGSVHNVRLTEPINLFPVHHFAFIILFPHTMLDRKFIVENVDLVKKNCALRGAKADIDRFLVPGRTAAR